MKRRLFLKSMLLGAAVATGLARVRLELPRETDSVNARLTMEHIRIAKDALSRADLLELQAEAYARHIDDLVLFGTAVTRTVLTPPERDWFSLDGP